MKDYIVQLKLKLCEPDASQRICLEGLLEDAVFECAERSGLEFNMLVFSYSSN